MKIVRVDIIPVSIPPSRSLRVGTYGELGRMLDFVLAKVYTDDGIVGYGEAPPLPPLSPESQDIIVSVLEKRLVPVILGEDPFDLERIWEKMDLVAPTYPMAKAVIDIALHDIIGKSLKVPLYKLLGGELLKRFPIVGLVGLGPKEYVVSEAMRLVNEGYTGLRLKISPGMDVELVKAVRESVGDNITIRVDANQSYPTHKAIKVIKALERYEIELVEQPTVWWDFKGLAKVAKSVDTPIMPHESLYLISDVKALLDMGAMDVLGLKTYRPGGGITSARKLIHMAQVLNIPCLLHDDIELGVSLAAAMHFIAANYRHIKFKCELSGYPDWVSDDVVKEPLKIGRGFAEIPQGPGLGVEIDDQKVMKYSKGIITCKL